MFYCDPCGRENEWPTEFFVPTSRGPCEVCAVTTICYDVPTRQLPLPPNTAPVLDESDVSQDEIDAAIQSIKEAP